MFGVWYMPVLASSVFMATAAKATSATTNNAIVDLLSLIAFLQSNRYLYVPVTPLFSRAGL
jgi:hypothetical protein